MRVSVRFCPVHPPLTAAPPFLSHNAAYQLKNYHEQAHHLTLAEVDTQQGRGAAVDQQQDGSSPPGSIRLVPSHFWLALR
jgi:hypothetical protein